ncbi:MAG: FHA domain-containing protein [Pirellulales bacterium]
MKSDSAYGSAASDPVRSATVLLSTHVMNLRGLDRVSRLRQDEDARSSATAYHIVWIDGVGGYLLWDRNELVIGQAFAGSGADIGIVGDLSRQAAAIRRIGGDYLLQPLQRTSLNGHVIDRSQLLSDQSRIELGQSVKMDFRRPNPLSATARLEIAGIHRWQPYVDAVVLLADCCILGPRPGSHIECREWSSELMLIQKGAQWHFKTGVDVDVNGRTQRGTFPVVRGMNVRGEDFSLSIE